MKTLLIAGIGNIFHGDDAFGCEVARAAAQRAWPEGVRVSDFGILGCDLAFAIEGGWDAVILVDATPRGQPPGTVYLIEPALSDLDAAQAAGVPDAHGMNPVRVLEMVKANGGTPPRLFLVGCEPAVLEAGVIACRAGHRFSVREAGRSADGAPTHLDPLPLLVKSETVQVALAREPADASQTNHDP